MAAERPPERESRTSLVDKAAYYDEFYYRHCCGRPYRRDDEWLAFFGRIADRIVSLVSPRTVLDAGCAHGLLVEGLRKRGVAADGIDISSFAIDQVHESVRAFCRRADVTADVSRQYDLILSIEVLEHLTSDDGERAIANFCAHTDDVLFSSTPWDFREPTHVTVRGPEHWAELFALNGFHRDIDFDASFITPWAVRFRRASDPPSRLVRHYERRQWALQREAHDARQYALEVHRQFAAVERERDADRAELAQMRQSIEGLKQQLCAEMQRARQALDDSHSAEREAAAALERSLAAALAERAALQLGLTETRNRIVDMERSVFWRMRQLIRG